MKNLIVSLTIGACLLVSSAGVVFATDPHSLVPGSKGQPGAGGVGISCGGTGVNGTPTPPPGQATNSSVNSPFNDATKVYAGAGAGNSGGASPNANSQYDVACFQMH